ncbi:MAG: DNA repair protein RadA [Candidatus Berkelbacteria bacterium]|nr:DNA repair protein RadA [Candidatus Berkelbacteria bacterium]
MAKKQSTIWLCENCGNEFSVWAGKCPMCGEWNSLKELKFEGSKPNIGSSRKAIETSTLSDIKSENTSRLETGISELDRVLGGGVVPGSIILIGGEPGIGKSTLLLQVADRIGHTFYDSAEESINQIKLRADRLGITNSMLSLASESDIDAVLHETKKIEPKLLIIDSIQTVFTNDYDATPGSLVQVRECGMKLQQFAKSSGIPVIIIGHVTKEGNLAGPRILEHLVDTVLYLEGERFNDARILRGVKNRFGATNEVGIFKMAEEGMVEVKNPSELFLQERRNSPGSVVTVTLEGTRPILIEIQALVVPTHFGYPKRTSSGFDLNRLNLLAAVITKKTAFNLSNSDIYLNVIGGMKLNEPAVDLAVTAAIISSYKNKALPNKLCLFGEVGLLGEVRNVTRQKDREKEAKNLGYEITAKISDLSELVSLLVI